MDRHRARGLVATLTGVVFAVGCSHSLARETCDESKDTACGVVARESAIAGVDDVGYQRPIAGGSFGLTGTDQGQDFLGLLAPDGTFTWRRDVDAASFHVRALEFAGDGSAAFIPVPIDSNQGADLTALDVVRLDAGGGDLWTASTPWPSQLVLFATLAFDEAGDVTAAIVSASEENPGALFGPTQLTHVSAAGAVVWQVTVKHTILWLRARPDGGYDATGNCGDPDAFNPCALRLDGAGEVVWTRSLDNLLGAPWPAADGVVAIDGFGLAKIDDEGAYLWRRAFAKGECTGEGSEDGCGDGGISSLAVAPDGSIVANGSFPRDGADLGGGDMMAGRWIGRFQPDGAHLWSRHVECESFEPRVSVTDAGEAVYICGAPCGESGPPPGDAAPVTNTCFRLLVLSP
jgi:hypothetical protein